jgi:hypothetical protein
MCFQEVSRMHRKAKLGTGTTLVLWLLLATVSPTDAQAAVDGSWQAAVAVRKGGTIRFLFEFNASDGKLTGTVTLGDNPPVPIQEGRIRGDGDVITFKRISEGDDLDEIVFMGKVLKDEIRFAFSRIRGQVASDPINFTATRGERR